MMIIESVPLSFGESYYPFLSPLGGTFTQPKFYFERKSTLKK